MEFPFTAGQFFDVFGDYNRALWPAQVALNGLGVAAVMLVFVRHRAADAAVSAILAFLWAWLGIVYHLAFFSRINPAAYGFAAVSLAGAGVFLWQGVIRRRLDFAWSGGVRGIAGAGLVVFALLVYPAWSAFAGHRYPAMPTFGLPCPTTLFTIGLLALLRAPYPRSPFVVPVLWCAVGVQAAVRLDMPPDFALVVAGVIGAASMLRAGPGSLRMRWSR